MGENEKPPTKEEIETGKKVVSDLYEKEKEERETYLKSTEDERKKAFQESIRLISDLIDEKAFMIDRHKETTSQLRELNPDIEGTAEKIEKSVGEKAFMIDRQKEIAAQRAELHPDIEGTGEKIEKA
ncbi:MAG: hypothetical protein ACFFA0_14825, partial [Promethearchaeota archaeon]